MRYGKHFIGLAVAMAALMSGKNVQVASPNPAPADGTSTARTNGNKDVAPPVTVTNASHFADVMGFGRIAPNLRRREFIWIGHPRPMNHGKYLASKSMGRGANGGRYAR